MSSTEFPLPIYDINKTNTARFSLGRNTSNTLFVLSLNPSKASNIFFDPTLKNVDAFREILGFESFVMLNLYPQRATDPNDIHRRVQSKIYLENLNTIDRLVNKGSTVWACWGDLIAKRPFLVKSLLDIHRRLAPKKLQWIHYDEFTKKGHPKHPARKKHEDRFQKFDIQSYLKRLQYV